MGMKVYEGVVGMVGAGTWQDGGGGGKTVLSVLEIGDHHIKKIVVPDYLGNYLSPGTPSRVLVGTGLSHGAITRPFLAAVEVNGKKYKTDSVLFMFVLKAILYMLVALVAAAIFKPLGLLVAAGVIFYYARDYLSFKNF